MGWEHRGGLSSLGVNTTQPLPPRHQACWQTAAVGAGQDHFQLPFQNLLPTVTPSLATSPAHPHHSPLPTCSPASEGLWLHICLQSMDLGEHGGGCGRRWAGELASLSGRNRLFGFLLLALAGQLPSGSRTHPSPTSCPFLLADTSSPSELSADSPVVGVGACRHPQTSLQPLHIWLIVDHLSVIPVGQGATKVGSGVNSSPYPDVQMWLLKERREGGRRGREGGGEERRWEGEKGRGGHLTGKDKGSGSGELSPFTVPLYSKPLPVGPQLPLSLLSALSCARGPDLLQGPHPRLPCPLASGWAQAMGDWREDSQVGDLLHPLPQRAVGHSHRTPLSTASAPAGWARGGPCVVATATSCSGPSLLPRPLQAKGQTAPCCLVPHLPGGPLIPVCLYKQSLH